MKITIHWDNGDTLVFSKIFDTDSIEALQTLIENKNSVVRSFYRDGKKHVINADKIRMVELEKEDGEI